MKKDNHNMQATQKPRGVFAFIYSFTASNDSAITNFLNWTASAFPATCCGKLQLLFDRLILAFGLHNK